MPKWLKILLGILALGIITVVGLGIAGTMFLGDMMKKGSDPVEISKTVNTFATMPSLPPGFEWVMGMDLSIIKFASAKHGDDLNIIMGTIPLESGAENAEAIMAQLEQKQVTGSSDFQVGESGNETVGGETLAYKIGTAVDKKSGSRLPSMLGIITPKSWGKKAIFIFGTQVTGDKYDMTSTKQFLSAIQGFHQ